MCVSFSTNVHSVINFDIFYANCLTHPVSLESYFMLQCRVIASTCCHFNSTPTHSIAEIQQNQLQKERQQQYLAVPLVNPMP